MTPAWLLLSLLGPAGPLGGQGSSLAAAAAASGRPRECMSSSRRALSRGPSVWEMARVPNLQRYCDLIAKAQAELPTAPEAAKQSAAEADRALPGRAGPAVVMARAALALGALDDAARHFERARTLEPRSVEDPTTLHDLARVLRRTGKLDESLSVYRALVPRVDLLANAESKVLVLLEAAHVAMAAPVHDASAQSLRSRLDEAIAYLREARQRPPTQLAKDVLLSLVLALDRSGDRAQADAALGDAQRAGAKPRVGPAPYLASPDEGLALDALAAEGSDRAGAIKGWESYLQSPAGKGPWAAAARARLDVLKKGGSAPKSAAPADKPPAKKKKAAP